MDGLLNNYIKNIDELIVKKDNEYENVREINNQDIFSLKDNYISKVIDMLGYPLTSNIKCHNNRVKETLVSSNSNYDIFSLQIETMDNIFFSGKYYKMHNPTDKLVIVNSLDTFPYVEEKLVNKQVDIFIPNFLNVNRDNYDAKFRSLGGSLLSFELYNLKKSIDYFFLVMQYKKFGLIGYNIGSIISYYLSAIDNRITAVYTNKIDYIDNTLSLKNSKKIMDIKDIVSLIYPKQLMIFLDDTCKEDKLKYYWILNRTKHLNTSWINLSNSYLDDNDLKEFIERI